MKTKIRITITGKTTSATIMTATQSSDYQEINFKQRGKTNFEMEVEGIYNKMK